MLILVGALSSLATSIVCIGNSSLFFSSTLVSCEPLSGLFFFKYPFFCFESMKYYRDMSALISDHRGRASVEQPSPSLPPMKLFLLLLKSKEVKVHVFVTNQSIGRKPWAYRYR